MQVFYQSYDMETTEYVENFQALIGVVETYGGAYGREPGLVRAQLKKQEGVATADLDAPDPQQLKDAEAVCREEYLSCMVLRGADQSRYGKLKDDLSNNMTKGLDNFPKTIVEAMRLMTDHKVPARTPRVRAGGSEGVAFVQTGRATGGAAAAARRQGTTRAIAQSSLAMMRRNKECRTSVSKSAMKDTACSRSKMKMYTR